MVTVGYRSSKEEPESPEDTGEMEKKKTLSHTPPQYGTINGDLRDTCPTCRGIGRIPRGMPLKITSANW